MNEQQRKHEIKRLEHEIERLEESLSDNKSFYWVKDEIEKNKMRLKVLKNYGSKENNKSNPIELEFKEVYTMFYMCDVCGYDGIRYVHSYCPNCATEIEWKEE